MRSKTLGTHENRKATIGFVIFYPFQYFVMKEVFVHLAKDAEFIIDLGPHFPVRQPPALTEEIVALLQKENVPYRILSYDDYFYKGYLEEFFRKYTALVSLWERGSLLFECNKDKKKICLTYGSSKELNSVRPSRGLYDLVLSYGPRDHALFSYYTSSRIVGNPRFDPWFSNSLDQDVISEIRKLTNPHKKTLLYLPTHSDLSSLDLLASSLRKLTYTYNVITKLHYYTIREEPNRAGAFSGSAVAVYGDDVDLLPLLEVADVVLSDNSSAIFEAILADKPVIVADFWNEQYLDFDHKERKRYPRGWAGAVTYSGSIEQVIKRDGSVITLQKKTELRTKVEEALGDSLFYKERRKELREQLFAFNDGKCGERAAVAVRECIQNSLPERPILFHAMEAYKRTRGALSYRREEFLLNKIKKYEEIIIRSTKSSEIFFSVLLLPGETGCELESSLRGLLYQKFPAHSFEVFVLDATDSDLGKILDKTRELGNNAVNFMPISTRPLGTAINEVVRRARGTHVCFTTRDYIVGQDWLLGFHSVYKRMPHTAGVGGYIQSTKHASSSFDEYRYRVLGKKLMIHLQPMFLKSLYEVSSNAFFQNPAGDFASMSYVKKVFPILPMAMNDVRALSGHAKAMVLAHNKITFTPSAVSAVCEVGLRSFVRNCQKEGFIEALVAPKDTFFYGRSFWLNVVDALEAGLVARSFKFFLTVLLGNVVRWRGWQAGRKWGAHGFRALLPERL